MTKIDYTPPGPDEVLRFQLHRAITTLFKTHLINMEDLGDRHDEALAKLRDALPEQYKAYVDLADYLTEEEGVRLRKRILDGGNDTWREVERLLTQFNIDYKTHP